ncbi:MAG: hypothetical protein JNM84_26315 [Planctomycetes bacterium]|nr:hypothetical protein [Planctomycetota bacterium]
MSRRLTIHLGGGVLVILGLWIGFARESRRLAPVLPAPDLALVDREAAVVKMGSATAEAVRSSSPTILLNGPPELRVRLVDRGGSPIEGGEIMVADRYENLGSTSSPSGVSDRDGVAVFALIGEPRSFWCTAHAPGYAARVVPPRPRAPAAIGGSTDSGIPEITPEQLTVTLDLRSTLDLTVVTIEGDPVCDADVRAMASTHDPSLAVSRALFGSIWFEGRTDRHGFVQIPHAADEVLSLEVRKLGFMTHEELLEKRSEPAAQERILELKRIVVGGFEKPRAQTGLDHGISFMYPTNQALAGQGLAEGWYPMGPDKSACFEFLRKREGFDRAQLVMFVENESSPSGERRIELAVSDPWDPNGPSRTRVVFPLRLLEDLRAEDLARMDRKPWSGPWGELAVRLESADGKALQSLHPSLSWRIRSLDKAYQGPFGPASAELAEASNKGVSGDPRALRLIAGRYRIEPGYSRAFGEGIFAPQEVEVRSEQKSEVVISIDERVACLLRPRVVDEHGAPVARAMVHITGGPIGKVEQSIFSVGVHLGDVNERCPIVLSRVTPQGWYIRAVAPGYKGERVLILGEKGAPVPSSGVLVLTVQRTPDGE